MRISACRRLRRNTHAAIPTANAPEPMPVSTITLNVFQIPHPYSVVHAADRAETRQFAVGG